MNVAFNPEVFRPLTPRPARPSARSAERLADSIPAERLAQWSRLLQSGLGSSSAAPPSLVFLTQAADKARLARSLDSDDRDETMASATSLIVGYVPALPKAPALRLFPRAPKTEAWSVDHDQARDAAFRRSTLAGAYVILSGRAFGIECRPLTGFDQTAVDADFFAGTPIRTAMICNLAPSLTRL